MKSFIFIKNLNKWKYETHVNSFRKKIIIYYTVLFLRLQESTTAHKPQCVVRGKGILTDLQLFKYQNEAYSWQGVALKLMRKSVICYTEKRTSLSEHCSVYYLLKHVFWRWFGGVIRFNYQDLQDYKELYNEPN